MYFETLHQADTFDPLVDPEVYSCYETDLDEDTGFGSLIYDRVNGDSASAVNLIEVEDVLHKRDGTVTSVLQSINEGLETEHVRRHSIDARSTDSNGTLKDSSETPKSLSSQNSQDSGRDSNDSSQRARRKLSSEGRNKAIRDKPKETNLKTTVVQSRSKEKPASRVPVASTAKRSTNSGLPQRIVVGAQDTHYVELPNTLKSMKIASHSNSSRPTAPQVLSQPRYYPTLGAHQSATPMVSHNRYASQPVTTLRTTHSNEFEAKPSACKMPVYGARGPSSQHRYLGFV